MMNEFLISKVLSRFWILNHIIFHGYHTKGTIITKAASSDETKYLQIRKIKGYHHSGKWYRVVSVHHNKVWCICILLKEAY